MRSTASPSARRSAATRRVEGGKIIRHRLNPVPFLVALAVSSNLGAAATAGMLVWINKNYDPNQNWHASLIFLAVAFFLSGVMALGIRADVKIKEDEGPSQPDFAVAHRGN